MKIDIQKTDKKYSVIYADPPWAYLWGTGKTGGNFCPEKHYKTMSVEEICALGELFYNFNFSARASSASAATVVWPV